MGFGNHLGNISARGIMSVNKSAKQLGEQASILSERANSALNSSGLSQAIGSIQSMSKKQLEELVSFLEEQIKKAKEQIYKKDNIETMAENMRRERAAATGGRGKKRICNKSKKMRGGYTYKKISKSLSNASSEINVSSSSNSESNNKKTRKRKEKYNTI